MAVDAGALVRGDIELWGKQFGQEPSYRRMQNAVAQASVDDVALDREIVVRTDRSVSHLLDDWKVTNQKRSGRCWLFAGLNLLRVGAAKKMNLTDFEFSQNHTMFWDKLERANYFLEAMIETAGRDVDDRTVAHVMASAADDGGQWNMFAAVVAKHGLVPKTAMPETESSSDTSRLNASLRTVLHQGAKTLRETSGVAQQRERKREILGVVHRVLCIHLGTPPERIYWQWTDKDREFHRDGELTPLEFAEKYVTIPADDYVCLVDDPRSSSPRNQTLTVDYLGNVVGAPQVVYLNVDMATIKQIAADTIVSGEPVWFGCDVGQMMRRDLGIWDAELYDLAGVYDARLDLDKASRLAYHETQMTHAMLFTGVDLVDNRPRRWRVENSWGDEGGVDGFYTMNDNWFDEHVFEIACRRDQLSPELQAALDQPPVVLPAWDPMGALAHGS
ncbi:MAG TPA: C1 family peptidase [Nocardioidaceae bacterium]|nr:C1 family peptidase [Nocardioidaceae bacterium]